MQAVLQWAARFNGKQLPPGTLIHHSAKLHGHPSVPATLDASVTMQPPDVGVADQAEQPPVGNGCASTALVQGDIGMSRRIDCDRVCGSRKAYMYEYACLQG